MRFAQLLFSCYRIPGAHNHASTVDHPLLGRALEEYGETPMAYGIHVSSAKPCHWVWMDLWPNYHVGPSLPSPPPYSGGGSLQTDFAGWWRPGLAIHLCVDEWCCVPCASVQQGTHWHYDRWHAQCKCLWQSPPVVSTKVTANWGPGGLSRRAKWGA